jgi:hypothetical protein
MVNPDPHRGLVSGIVRYRSGQPSAECSVWGEPTAFPPPPHDPLAGGLRDINMVTNAAGRYQLDLPPATYTIRAHGTSPVGTEVWGRVEDVVVTPGGHVTVDLTVTGESD